MEKTWLEVSRNGQRNLTETKRLLAKMQEKYPEKIMGLETKKELEKLQKGLRISERGIWFMLGVVVSWLSLPLFGLVKF